MVIPIELRRTLDIGEKDSFEIYVDEDRIILKKYKPNMTCAITDEIFDDNLLLSGGKLILSREGTDHLLKEIMASFKLAYNKRLQKLFVL